jgi:hypothetical protein
VPAASYFESDLCRDTVDQFAPLFERGCLWLVGSGSTTDEFAELKLAQYRPRTPQHNRYSAVRQSPVPHPPFRSRRRSATEDLIHFWNATLEAPDFPTSIFGRDADLPADLETLWAAVPERLAGSAFIVDYVEPLVFQGAGLVVHNRLHGVINEGYFESFAQEFEAGLMIDMTHLGSSHALRSGNVDLPYRTVREALRLRGVLSEIARASPEALIDLREDPRVAQTFIESLFDQLGPNAYDSLAIQLQLTDPPDLGECAHLIWPHLGR